MTLRRPVAPSELGATTLGTSAGFVVFLLLMLAAIQILFNLYATSMVTSAAHEAARTVAGFDAEGDRCAAVAAAEAQFVETLGDYGEAGHAELIWECSDPEVVTVRIVAQHPTILPRRLAGLIELGRLDRTITVLIEEFQ